MASPMGHAPFTPTLSLSGRSVGAAAGPVPSRPPPVRRPVALDWQLTSVHRSMVLPVQTPGLAPLAGVVQARDEWLPEPLVMGALAAQTELRYQLAIALDVVGPHVVEEPAAPTDELHQPPAGVMIGLVHLEVLGQIGNSLAEDRHLDFG